MTQGDEMRASLSFVVGRVVAAIFAAFSLSLDAQDAGWSRWIVLAVSVGLFLILTVMYEVSLYRQIHSVEAAVEVEIEPAPSGHDLQWLAWSCDPARRVTSANASMILTIRNPTGIHRAVSKTYVELSHARTWWRRWPRPVLQIKPFIIGLDGNWFERPDPAVVDWDIPVGGGTFRERVFFSDLGIVDGPKITTAQASFFLVLEFGSSKHRFRRELHV